eukprot:scaffold1682_cov35-Attheya_sp.AAC.1
MSSTQHIPVTNVVIEVRFSAKETKKACDLANILTVEKISPPSQASPSVTKRSAASLRVRLPPLSVNGVTCGEGGDDSFDGFIEGRLLGSLDGGVVGTIDGFLDEVCVGKLVGPFDGFRDGCLLAIIDGVAVLCSMDGLFEDILDGTSVGTFDGLGEGR